MSLRKMKPSLLTRLILTVRLFFEKRHKLPIGEDASLSPDLLRKIHGDPEPRVKKK